MGIEELSVGFNRAFIKGLEDVDPGEEWSQVFLHQRELGWAEMGWGGAIPGVCLTWSSS